MLLKVLLGVADGHGLNIWWEGQMVFEGFAI
jgi:hypothetical protein